ncbi:hypothetical protein [Corynebacterium diphtheriae]|uniref:hypothetical protein n=1 Tax=Corynebacterium diphtheriae TaxID=1717 RepID=UPI000B4B74C6|nr:hypothetical protein [Corynebacterium diphtheriae]OWN05096.1 hypothetical protein AY473_00955 [Corynebacterium diphtheriae bv. mitis]OWO27831.1 hypothetical protein AY536_10870 [Corynebacterium diphtheriae bv. mitis]OWX98769.1 hypothetical protein B1A53_07720 [Corynebacterium diphtheriae]CAB0693890.1 hypothetical protein FRC0032_01099 [Corynebacterium diphtheriae]CAB0761849.1 hypothetical protein FRC0137_02082 [Corynebacterium diphtheriae]
MTTNDNLDRLGARIYGAESTAEADKRGGRVYGHNNDTDALGARIYGLGDRGAVSHERPTPEHTTAEVPRNGDLDAIGARIEARHNGHPGTVTADNRGGRGDTPGLAGFDY